MATYNGETYIAQQISSILKQLGKNDEVIISDDGSTDKTLSIIHSFADKRIKIFHNQERHGVIPNFENAISKAKGDYVFLSDQDDIWYDDKVKVCSALLEQNILVVHDAHIVDANGNIITDSFFKLRSSKPGYIYNLWKNSYLGCCMCFRKELLNKLLPIPNNIEMHDRWIGLIAQMYGKVFFENKCLIGYRVHGHNVSNSTEKSKNSFWTMIVIRYYLLYHTLLRYITLANHSK